jgi:hypothetical protein
MGMNSMDFSGSAGHIAGAWATGEMDSAAGDVTVFIVAAMTGDGCLYDSGAAASTTHNGITVGRVSGTLNLTGKYPDHAAVVAGAANTATGAQLITAIHATNALYLRVNRTQVATVSCPNPVAQSYFRLGKALDGTLPLTGKIYEVVVCQGALDAAGLARMESYLSKKWGL